MVRREASVWGSASGPFDAVVARRIRPCCAESSPYVGRSSGTFDAACRRSSVAVTTSSSVPRTLPCRLAESPDFSPPPSPAIAVPATFLSLMDARAGCEMATTPSPLAVLSIVNGYPKRTLSRPSGPACCFVFGYRLGTGVPPWGPPPHPRPRRAQRWLHRAARGGVLRQSPNRPIARRIRRRRERPDRLRVRCFRLLRIGVSAPAKFPPPSAVQAGAAALCRGVWPFRIRRGAAAPRRRRGRPG